MRQADSDSAVKLDGCDLAVNVQTARGEIVRRERMPPDRDTVSAALGKHQHIAALQQTLALIEVHVGVSDQLDSVLKHVGSPSSVRRMRGGAGYGYDAYFADMHGGRSAPSAASPLTNTPESGKSCTFACNYYKSVTIFQRIAQLLRSQTRGSCVFCPRSSPFLFLRL